VFPIIGYFSLKSHNFLGSEKRVDVEEVMRKVISQQMSFGDGFIAAVKFFSGPILPSPVKRYIADKFPLQNKFVRYLTTPL
jgi:hypothetical protein